MENEFVGPGFQPAAAFPPGAPRESAAAARKGCPTRSLAMSARAKRIRFWVTLLGTLVLLGGAAAGVYRLRKAQAAVSFPVAPARKGDFLVIIRCRGDVKAGKS